ncbi:hypothetical protein BT63DRAFT_484401 [Microthyrium microscopicum]|uniref:Uncharacterized protein n=1 Tax=Microthyrium microscopicum TaxID=703497 RepID=A0A6A6TVH9_9PEZI|nr:hypothetical protein BT63DRAFT_484401 [Microthyrium microscopicum]
MFTTVFIAQNINSIRSILDRMEKMLRVAESDDLPQMILRSSSSSTPKCPEPPTEKLWDIIEQRYDALPRFEHTLYTVLAVIATVLLIFGIILVVLACTGRIDPENSRTRIHNLQDAIDALIATLQATRDKQAVDQKLHISEIMQLQDTINELQAKLQAADIKPEVDERSTNTTETHHAQTNNLDHLDYPHEWQQILQKCKDMLESRPRASENKPEVDKPSTNAKESRHADFKMIDFKVPECTLREPRDFGDLLLAQQRAVGNKSGWNKSSTKTTGVLSVPYNDIFGTEHQGSSIKSPQEFEHIRLQKNIDELQLRLHAVENKLEIHQCTGKFTDRKNQTDEEITNRILEQREHRQRLQRIKREINEASAAIPATVAASVASSSDDAGILTPTSSEGTDNGRDSTERVK